MKDKNFWLCNNDEHINNISNDNCEICGEKRPSIINIYFDLTNIYGKVNLFWETKNAEKVYILHKKNIIEVSLTGNIQLDDISNNEEIVIQASNNIADYKEKVIITNSKPEIISFVFNKSKVIIGDTILVKWETINATKVSISKMGLMQLNGEHSITIVEKTDLTIIAENEIGIVEDTITIYVLPSPKILFFTADYFKVIDGDSAEIFWKVENANEVVLKLSGDVLSNSNIGSMVIKPKKQSTYELIVTALDGKSIINEFLTVEVFKSGIISFFKADKQFIFPTIPITLSWEVTNALKVEIEGLGNFQLAGQITLQPTVDTTYKLKVTDNFGTFTRDLQIKMLPLPMIESLFIPAPIINQTMNLQIFFPKFPEIDISINSLDNRVEIIETKLNNSLPSFNSINLDKIELTKQEYKNNFGTINNSFLSKLLNINKNK